FRPFAAGAQAGFHVSEEVEDDGGFLPHGEGGREEKSEEDETSRAHVQSLSTVYRCRSSCCAEHVKNNILFEKFQVKESFQFGKFFLLVQDSAHGFQNLVHEERLADIARGSAFQALLQLLRAVGGGANEHGNVLGFRFGLELVQHVGAIDAGDAHVQEDE